MLMERWTILRRRITPTAPPTNATGTCEEWRVLAFQVLAFRVVAFRVLAFRVFVFRLDGLRVVGS